jgi:DNA-binding response OmpR family regulator
MPLATILIVDDNRDLAHALELRLRANDYRTLLATDGSSAVTLALSEKPFAVLLDLNLPKEDGFAVMEEFHRSPALSSVPVIIVSADCLAVTQRRVLDAGAHAFLEKPVNHRLLLAILRDLPLQSQDPACVMVEAQPDSLLN